MAAVENQPHLSRTHPRSKFLKAITDRQQEISNWAKEGRPNIEFARQLGQLTENVTLDLMLHEHLYELSRSRYKYKTNNRYEKKMFLQRQMMKSSVLREKLKNVQIDDKRPRWAQGNKVSMRPSIKAPETVQPQTPVAPSKRLRASPSLKPKPDSAPLRRNPVLVTEMPRAQTRNTFYESNKSQQRLSSPKEEPGERFFQTEPLLTPSRRQRTPTIAETNAQLRGMITTPVNKAAPGNLTPVNKSTPREVPFSRDLALPIPPKTAPERLNPDVPYMDQSLGRPQMSKKKAQAAQKAHLQSWAQANRAVNEKRPVRDERYLRLERSLSDSYSKPNAPKVEDIVQSIETLSVEPKRRTDRGPRLTSQIKAFLAKNKMSLVI